MTNDIAPALAADPDALTIATIRTLCMDAVQAANSGHPGTPMAMAPVIHTLWQRFLRFDPEDPTWPNRDRFVLSAGHASTLLYSMLHLARVKAVNPSYETVGEPTISLEDLRRFRQLDSRAPGHPEYRWTSGVETTTGPLGAGYATSVGMAIASQWQAAHFDRPGFELFDFDVYALGGDGCMQEGVASEAASLAGHLRLSNLCWIYDNNHITIEGNTSLAFTEDVGTRFLAYGWNVVRVSDANDTDGLARAFDTFRSETGRPTLIIVDSHIAYGAPTKQDTSAAHGEPLGADEIRATKRAYGWPQDATFLVPEAVYEHVRSGVGERGAAAHAVWLERFGAYGASHPELAEEVLLMQRRELPEDWDADLPEFPADPRGVAGRDASATALNALAGRIPWLVGGAADLAPSTKTRLTVDGAGDFGPEDRAGRNLHFGVREHAMGSIVNGLALSKLRPFGSGFLIFSEYAKMPLRLAALMEIPSITVFTHDSIGVGEDGPTHQPIEQLAALRATPGLVTIRPGDANEVAEAWRYTMGAPHDPVCFILSRQAMPTLDRTRFASAVGLAQGAYILADPEDGLVPEAILIATGTEVGLAVEAYEQLSADGVRLRLVSMPSWALFERQPSEYRESVLPREVRARVAVEQASTFGWERYVGADGAVIGMHTFGASAPLKDLQARFGFTPDAVADAVRSQLLGRTA